VEKHRIALGLVRVLFLLLIFKIHLDKIGLCREKTLCVRVIYAILLANLRWGLQVGWVGKN